MTMNMTREEYIHEVDRLNGIIAEFQTERLRGQKESEVLLRALPNKQRMFYHQISEMLAESISDWHAGEMSDGQHEKWVKLVRSCVVGFTPVCPPPRKTTDDKEIGPR